MRFILPLVLLAAVAIAEEPIAPERRQQMLRQFEEQKTGIDAELKKDPESVEWLSRRGDLRLFLGDAKGAVEDFEKEIKIDPSHDAPHWRLGIAYYFVGDYAKSAAQFAKYHAYDDRDRENGVWQFLANAKVKGVEAARKEMLGYARFDREPFPDLYEMFAGKKTGADVLASAEKKGLKDDALVMFFAHYYIGLNEQLLGNAAAATDHLAKAVKLSFEARAGGGPGYMSQVARLHYEAAKKMNEKSASPK
jgi:lipoprotein NlpI